MTPMMIRQTLARMLTKDLLSRSMTALSDLTSDVSTESLNTAVDKLSFEFNPNNTYGLIVDRIHGELPLEGVSKESIAQTYEELSTDADSPVYASIESLSRSLTSYTRSSYEALQDSILPAAEGVLEDLTIALSKESFFDKATRERDIAIESFDWGVLADPAIVSEAIIVAREEANNFHPDQAIRPYFVQGCLSSASRYAPSAVSPQERDKVEALIAGVEGLDKGMIKTYTGFFCSPQSFNYLHNSLRPLYDASKTVLKASEMIAKLFAMESKLDEIVMGTEDWSKTLKDNVSNGHKALNLYAAALHAARHSFYKNTLVLDETLSAEGAVEKLVVNSDLSESSGMESLTPENMVGIADYQNAQGISFSSRGISAGYALENLDKAKAYFDKQEQARQSRLLAEDSDDFRRSLGEVLSTHTTDYFAIVRPSNVHPNLKSCMESAIASATRAEDNALDIVSRYFVDITGNESLTRMVDDLAVVASTESVSEQRHQAFTKFLLDTIVQPKYCVA